MTGPRKTEGDERLRAELSRTEEGVRGQVKEGGNGRR